MRYVVIQAYSTAWLNDNYDLGFTLVGRTINTIRKTSLDNKGHYTNVWFTIEGGALPTNGNKGWFASRLKLKEFPESSQESQGSWVEPQESVKHILKLSTQHFINGTNIKDMSASACISCIADAKDDIARLEALDVNSSAITKQIADLNKGIEVVVKVLDAKK